MEEIDFVLTWVDGDDPIWIKEKNKYLGQKPVDGINSDANSDCRYRADHDLLRYWFRLVEKNAPWVHRIHFVSCGQIPEWLNTDHPIINVVDHADYIPQEYLPTFNARPIELNLHRIESLSEQYVQFNDDMFLLQPVTPEFFFKNGKPVLSTDLRYSHKVGFNNWSRTLFNDYCVLNQSFNTRRAIWNNRQAWFSVSRLGVKRVFQNLRCFFANKTIPIYNYGHLGYPQLKSTLREVWETVPDIMDITCSSKFRTDEQVN